jgi:hypothetical protein
MTRFRLLFLSLALTLTLGGSAAFADDLNLGGSYNTFNILEGTTVVNTGGGAILPSSLNGTSLAWVYCVGLFTDVNVPEDYPTTITTNNGVVNGAAVNNAGEIAWLLDTYAAAAVGTTASAINSQEALQAAIWTVEYDNGAGGHPMVYGDTGQSYSADYAADIAALGSNTAVLTNIDWFTPGGASNYNVQGLVGPGPSAVPEPTSILLFGTVLLLSAKLMKRKPDASL